MISMEFCWRRVTQLTAGSGGDREWRGRGEEEEGYLGILSLVFTLQFILGKELKFSNQFCMCMCAHMGAYMCVCVVWCVISAKTDQKTSLDGNLHL